MTWPAPHAIGARVVAIDDHYHWRKGHTGTVVAYDLDSCCPYVVEFSDGERNHFNDLEIEAVTP